MTNSYNRRNYKRQLAWLWVCDVHPQVAMKIEQLTNEEFPTQKRGRPIDKKTIEAVRKLGGAE